jgi:mono/diheme cytochrome c family protein
MRFLRDAVVTLLILALIGTIAVLLLVRRGGLAANKEPGRLEHSIADRLVRLSIPAGADRQTNPFSADPDAWREVREHYMDHCAVCHGRDGRGSEIGANMYPRVPDLTDAEVQERSDGALFYIIQNGVRWTGMPAWQAEHSPEETWRLVSFIRKAPTLTAADVAEEKPTATTGEQPHGEPGHTHPGR